jgi:hypothetical protein
MFEISNTISSFSGIYSYFHVLYPFAVIIVSGSTDITTRMISGRVGIWIKIHLNPTHDHKKSLLEYR